MPMMPVFGKVLLRCTFDMQASYVMLKLSLILDCSGKIVARS